MSNLNTTTLAEPIKSEGGKLSHLTVGDEDVQAMLDRYQFSADARRSVAEEKLLPTGLLSRLQAAYPQHSGLLEAKPFLFKVGSNYTGLEGFRRVCEILKQNGIELSRIKEREFYIEVYRFLATSHSLNSINWDNYETDSVYQLVLPQPGMIIPEPTRAYVEAPTEAERARIVAEYTEKTNPHDGNQQLNKPWFENAAGQVEFLEGSQHKYPQCQLVFDASTQNCFSFCTYCFRHAQVRGDEDMFLQKDIAQLHNYLRQHQEVTDLLITGGDGGFMPANRFEEYIRPIIEDPALGHIRNIRLGSRALTFHPEMILSGKYDRMLELFDLLYDNGIQMAWMAHFSTPRELLNPRTIAAIRRLKAHNVFVRSQSPIMNHISLFTDEKGKVDVDRSAQNWIDLANILAMLGIGFHSMYAARPTGEHHYFTAPLADIERIFSKIYNSLSSINRPSRHISMTISAGKLAILGTSVIGGEKCFALQFTEGRNMEWMNRVFHAKYDEQKNKIDLLLPFDTEKFFFAEELKEIEANLAEALRRRLA
jgi:L-lysine 2,3-aminomutase